MKKLLSTITALSMITASTAGLSVSAFGTGTGFASVLREAVSEVNATAAPSTAPTATAAPSAAPTATATANPTAKPTEAVTAKPTDNPTATPVVTATPEVTSTPEVTDTPAPTAAVPKLTAVTINKQNLTLKAGESFELEIKTEPEDAPKEKIEWSTSSECVTIAESGKVTGVRSGTAVVSAVTSESKLIASCYITVEDEKGTLKLNASEGVASVRLTKDGVTNEITAGDNLVEQGTYKVEAESRVGYKLNDYSESVTIAKGEASTLDVTAEKTECTVTLPSVTGITVTPVQGSASPVAKGGSYSFTISAGSSYDASNLVVKANGNVITVVDGIYTINNILEDVVISIEGIETKSWDATLKSVKVKDTAAVLGADNTYTATLPFGETAVLSDIVIEVNDSKSSYTVASDNGEYIISVKAEDGTANTYKLKVTNSEATVIDSFKVAISALKFNDITQTSSGNYDSQDTVRKNIEVKIEKIAPEYPSVTYTIANEEAKAPVKGTLASPTGEDGYYHYTITLTEGEETRTIALELEVKSYNYVVSAANITTNTTNITIRNIDRNSEVALFSTGGTRMKPWTTPTNGTVTFSNLGSDTTYVVKIREQGSSDIPSTGTQVRTAESKTRGSWRYYTVTFDEGDHGKIVSGKSKQSVRLTHVPDYPVVKADAGYVFKGWSANGVLVDNPSTYYIRSATSFIAIYERSSGSTYSSSPSDSNLYNYSNTTNTTKNPVSFNDVPSTSWYYNSVTNVCGKGYMNGTVNGRFEPETTLTRGMLVTILYRYAAEPNVSGISTIFNDVPQGQWYSDAVTWASDAGIVNGVSDTEFAPETNITREQLAAIMYRYCEAFGYDTSAAGNIIKYNDSAAISDWAQTALIWTTGAGIVNGKDGNRLDPQGKATRAEAAAIIERFDEFVNY